MNRLLRWLASFAMALALPVAAQTPAPVIVVNLADLTGAAAVAGNNFNNGVQLAFKEINATGGILNQKVQLVTFDTQTNPDVAKALAQKALALQPVAVMGPVFSAMTLATMDVIKDAQVPQFTGGEAADITLKGNPYVFRTSLTQTAAMPRVAKYMKDVVRTRNLALVTVNNPFGKGGHDEMLKAAKAQGFSVVADLVVEPQQDKFDETVTKLIDSKADTAFVYLNEEESARFLLAARRLEYPGNIVGETTIVGQYVIDKAGEAANGVRAHVGLTPHALGANVRGFDNKFIKEYRYRSDHNGMKGYIGAYVLKAVTEKVGKFDAKAIAEAMKNVSLTVQQYPGILYDVKYDDKGDLSRTSFIVRVAGERHEFIATLPAEGAAQTAPAPKK
jgi:branched-chain amino acid transport system substrate-binding protein